MSMTVFAVYDHFDVTGYFATRELAEAARLALFEREKAKGLERQRAQSAERAAWGRDVEAGGGVAVGWSLPRESDYTVAEIPVEGALPLLADARRLLLPLEWIDDRGRECAWCGATRHTFNRPDVMGTDRERKARDNHRDDCRWLGFIRATEGMGDK